MIMWLHRLRRDEEGQTLVLGAVFGIILALCVLGTVNLGRAVYEKIQLQTACDDGAYSQAAVEARVLNLTAYTNRAMVVHYSSIMAMSAYLTWLHFTDVWVHALNQVLSYIPYIGEVFAIINSVISVILDILDYAVAFMTPIVAAASVVLYGLQEGAWNALYFGRLAAIPTEAHSGDSNNDAYRPIWPALIPLANMTVFSQTRGGSNLIPFQSAIQSLEIFLNMPTPAVQEARLHMLEIANSARPPWVAYGDNYGNPSWSPFARHWSWRAPFACNAQLGTNARTQLGGWAPGLTLGGLLNTSGEVYSASRGQFSLHCRVPFYGPFSLIVRIFDLVTLDQFLGFTSLTPQSIFTGYGIIQKPGGLLGLAITALLNRTPLPALGNAAVAYANQYAKPKADYRAMWISPYVFFAPSTRSGPAGGLGAIGGGLGNFGQPDIVFGLARQRADFNRPPANPNAFLNQHAVGGIVRGQGGQVDFAYTGADWPTVPGLPGPLQLHEGFNALCAAQTYYHRPGDWKEMPNFFNPLWAARLMPVVESNAGAALGVTVVPLLNKFLLH